ncbi:helix-turn-helix domain-containing protein [Pseudonocardia pini]|uniref:helix-turn-helix domain-containing protein n=1 Tax=Pseudonocardia pini TaxID=2758030 RepID=UPI0015F08E86|nr:helix-turn-helix domain-containing protein [Pseudonocardia pini]
MQDEELGRSSDARGLPPEDLEKLRRRAVGAVEAGVPQIQVALQLGVSRRAVGQWVRAFRESGEASFRPGRRGRRPGERLSLAPWQQERVLTTLAAGPPDAQGLPWLLWTRRSVAELIRRDLAVTLSTVTVARYLARWGILGPRPEPPPAGLDREVEARAAVRAALTWVGVSLPGQVAGHGLIAVTDQEILHFLLSPTPFDRAGLDDLERRLRMQIGRDVEVALAACPRRQADLVAGWLDRRR